MKDEIMNYLRTGKHRIIAAIVITLVMVTCTAVVNANPTVKSFNITKVEPSFYLNFSNGERGGKAVCLKNKTQKDLLADGWKWYTCNDLNSPLKWHECVIHKESMSFMCRPLHPAIKGVSL